MAIIYHQSSSLTYGESDLPLATTGVEEGTRGRNLSRAPGQNGQLVTFKEGVWIHGWYEPYIGLVDNTVLPGDLQGLPNDLTGMGGYQLVLDDSLNSWDLIPMNGPYGASSITWSELVYKATSSTLSKGDEFIITDKNNMLVTIAYISVPSGFAFYEVMTDYGQLSHTKIE